MPVDRRQRMGAHAVYPWVLCCPHGVIDSNTPENQVYPYSGHSCIHRHPHDFRKLFIEGRQITEYRGVL